MTETLAFATADFEPVYGWLEQHADVEVEVWGMEYGRRAALLAYRRAGPDAFGWANWIGQLFEDPSEICQAFERLELDLAGDGAALQADFPGVFAAPAAGGWHAAPAAHAPPGPPGPTSVPRA